MLDACSSMAHVTTLPCLVSPACAPRAAGTVKAIADEVDRNPVDFIAHVGA